MASDRTEILVSRFTMFMRDPPIVGAIATVQLHPFGDYGVLYLVEWKDRWHATYEHIPDVEFYALLESLPEWPECTSGFQIMEDVGDGDWVVQCTC